MKKRMLIVLGAGMLMLQGCCTVMVGNKEDIWITSVPPGATVTTPQGVSILTPGTFSVNKRDATSLTITKSGYETKVVEFQKDFEWGWMFTNIFWDFGLITGIIDYATGSSIKIKNTNILVRLQSTDGSKDAESRYLIIDGKVIKKEQL